mmetsp:Transcript_28555/g.96155  ORF Transcript_28555/g.96155 Transcript_28555/m.96155 type:complete len:223 (+) Transcript_28555:93-761(+)
MAPGAVMGVGWGFEFRPFGRGVLRGGVGGVGERRRGPRLFRGRVARAEESVDDFRLKGIDRILLAVDADGQALSIHKILEKVAADLARLVQLEQRVDWRRVRTVDVNLLEQRKFDAVLSTRERGNVGVGAVLLPELVAGKGEDLQTFCLIPSVQVVQRLIRRIRLASLRGHVDDQRYLARVARQRDEFAVDGRGRRSVDALGRERAGLDGLLRGRPVEVEDD